MKLKPTPVTRYAASLINKYDKRPYAASLCVKDGKAYATDCKSAVIFDTDLPDGAYAFTRNTKTKQEVGRTGDLPEIPDYDRLINTPGTNLELLPKTNELLFAFDVIKALPDVSKPYDASRIVALTPLVICTDTVVIRVTDDTNMLIVSESDGIWHALVMCVHRS